MSEWVGECVYMYIREMSTHVLKNALIATHPLNVAVSFRLVFVVQLVRGLCKRSCDCHVTNM